MYKVLQTAIAVIILSGVTNAFAHTQGDDCKTILKKHDTIGDLPTMQCWYGTSGNDDMRVSNEFHVMINGKDVGVYSSDNVNIFLGFDGDDTIEGGKGINVVLGMKGKDTLSGHGFTIVKGGVGEDKLIEGLEGVTIMENLSEDTYPEIDDRGSSVIAKVSSLSYDDILDILKNIKEQIQNTSSNKSL